MASNSFGDILRITTFGESHGPALGVVVDGVPAGLALDEQDLQSGTREHRRGTAAGGAAADDDDIKFTHDNNS